MPTPEELDQQIAELEAQARWQDVARAIEQRAELGSNDSRVTALVRLVLLYNDKFGNHALAMRAAERILEYEPDHVEAIAYLRDAYAKRRDWEALNALDARRENKTRGPFR